MFFQEKKRKKLPVYWPTKLAALRPNMRMGGDVGLKILFFLAWLKIGDSETACEPWVGIWKGRFPQNPCG